ncbi:hypothetical protein CEUSTIGMA_g2971.t1 [Chlamydomonas eustigma]|uniref:Uncharacterized protein n=1 Tax=Chlamydomonas eustigma TaxID=1157962 RepID=A0A250WXF8_9CHLO|nr:hypothetical protein CEUSTIGMA_g2971.t1 [Chlamydomonas eustigma]|eukprot:GAX75528.1 hypothetical protein CEUSTIGMA_g2971.t1 [Chlamydomonas eustigma]
MKKTVFTAARNESTVTLGDEEKGSMEWRTEYDSEFANKLGMSIERYVPAYKPTPGTPRSFKQGFVHHQDYENLDNRYNRMKTLSEELQARLVTARNLMNSWKQDESDLMLAVSQEHDLLGETHDRLRTAAESMKALMSTAKRNEEIMHVIGGGHGIPLRTKELPVEKSATAAPSHQHGSHNKSERPCQEANKREDALVLSRQLKDMDSQYVEGAVLKERLSRMEAHLAALASNIQRVADSAPALMASMPPQNQRIRSPFVERMDAYPKFRSAYTKKAPLKPWC